jgi:subtilisin family serine protease
MKKTLLLFVFVLFLFATKAQTVYKDYIDGQAYFAVNHELYQQIKTKIGPKDAALNKLEYFNFLGKIFNKYGVYQIYQPFDNADSEKILRIIKIKFTEIDKIDDLLADLSKVNGLYNVEKVPLYHTFATPNDKYYGMQYSGGTPVLWHLNVIGAPQAWDIAYGNTNGKVGIVDNAILDTHEDLSGVIAKAYDGETDSEGSSAPPQNEYEWSHGTHCAGLIGAETNNTLGVASIGSGVEIYAAKAGRNSDGALYYIAEGLNWQADQPINVLSLSFGGSGSSQNEQDWYTYMHDTKDVVILAAAGNDGVTTESYPAAYDNVIAVASTDEDDARSDFSNYGSWVSIAAPGGYASNNASIFSTTASTKDWGEGEVPYDVMQGTSMACPLAAGLVGLMRSLNPALSAAEIENCLYNTCVNVGNFVQYGRIDAAAAMQCVQQTLNGDPIANFTANTTSVVEGGQVSFTDQSSDGGSAITSWSWSFPGGSPSSSTSQNPTVTYNTAGTYDVTLTVTNGNGNDTETKTGYITVTPMGNAFTLDFEACSDFQLTFDPWTVNDVDQTVTYGIQDVDFTHAGEAMAFIAFNPASCSPAQTEPAPHGGNRFGACFSSIPSEGSTNDDWLISPKVQLGTNSSFTVWVKSHTDQYGLERYRIGVSTTTNDPSAFTIISSGAYEEAPTTWTEKTYDLSAYDNQEVYVAINCVSEDAFIFMVDDISINTTTTGVNEISNNIKIYPNPTKDVINISGINNFNTIEIVNVNGKVVKEFNGYTNTININDLDNGNYLIKIITDDNVISKRISLIK